MRLHGTRLQRLMPTKCLALVMGATCHFLFFASVAVMSIALFGGMNLYQIPVQGFSALCFDLFLLLQFPLFHSLLLSTKGRHALAALFPGEIGRHLVTTTFVIFASLQLLLLFGLWAHLGTQQWEPSGVVLSVWKLVYGASWMLLGVSMMNAGLGTQMGYAGWVAVFRGKEPAYSPFPRHGLYTVCRHPVYFSMALVSATGPVWNVDHLVISLVFVAYCIVGPMVKDRRFRKKFGEAFVDYQRSVPFFPTPASCLRGLVRLR